MDLWTTFSTLAGGLGLFLLGMGMMTEGLKLAAGSALENILKGATRTRWHALGSGVLVTALVQSSSAVTVATIGFVNAGLLSLGGALWVLFGANVGTTMTGWLVALVGLKFKIEALALPLIGVGVVLRLTGAGQRRGAFGTALAGFGLLFLGISMLQQSFTGLAAQVQLPQGTGLWALLAQLAVGALMTVLMQSSSASMTIALTAAQGGLLPAQGAAAVVIGANIGTTVTALLAAIGATANAKRAASAHVVFNLLTGLVALALLPWLISAIAALQALLGLPADPAAKLALFHSVFNVLGVLLMWPVASRLTRWLLTRFRAPEDDEATPRYLDDNVLAVPTLAVDALTHEIDRLGRVSRRMMRRALAGEAVALLQRDDAVAGRLATAIDRFVERINRAAMSSASSAELVAALRLQRHHESSAEQALLAAPAAVQMHAQAGPEGTGVVVAAFQTEALAMLDALDAGNTQPEALQAMEAAYQRAKLGLLSAGAEGSVDMTRMEAGLRGLSALRRGLQQTHKAAVVRQGLDKPDRSEQPAGAPASVADVQR
jgi:phosphate:Na+ symporter